MRLEFKGESGDGRGNRIGGSCGTADPANAGRRARPIDAGRRRARLRGEVPEQSAAHADSGQRISGFPDCGCDRVDRSGDRVGGGFELAGGEHPELEIDLGRTHVKCQPGLQFGSRFVGGLMPGQVVDYLPEEQLSEAKNLAEFAGILALDKWTGNANGRQAVFTRKQRERRYRAVFIDFGYCFHAGEWRFEDAPLRGVYYRNDVYREITGWESFEPWLTRMETMPADTIWKVANEVPPEWYGGDLSEMESLVEKLLARRGRIRELIEGFGRSDRKPFPKWGDGEKRGKKIGRRTGGVLRLREE